MTVVYVEWQYHETRPCSVIISLLWQWYRV